MIRLIILLFAVGASLAAAQAPARPILRWGGDAEGGAPFVEADPRNPAQVVGFDVEVAQLLAEGLGRSPQFIQSGFTTLDAAASQIGRAHV